MQKKNLDLQKEKEIKSIKNQLNRDTLLGSLKYAELFKANIIVQI